MPSITCDWGVGQKLNLLLAHWRRLGRNGKPYLVHEKACTCIYLIVCYLNLTYLKMSSLPKPCISQMADFPCLRFKQKFTIRVEYMERYE